MLSPHALVKPQNPFIQTLIITKYDDRNITKNRSLQLLIVDYFYVTKF